MPEYHYISLLQLKLTHEYSEPAVYEGFEVVVSQETRQKISGQGLLFRNSKDGFHLLAEARDNGGVLEMTKPIDEEVRLQFFLSVKDLNFFNKTEGDRASLGSELFYFNSEDANTTPDGEELLNGPLLNPVRYVSSAFSQTKDDSNAVALRLTDPDGLEQDFRYRNDQARLEFAASKPGLYSLQEFDNGGTGIGTAEDIYFHLEAGANRPLIIFEAMLTPGWDISTPRLYLMRFEARAVIWRYQVYKHQTRFPEGITDIYNNLSINIPGSSDLPGGISFSAPSGSDPATLEASDSVKLREKPYRPIQLQNDGETVVENLSNPDVSRLQIDGSTWISNINVNLYL